ncbi:NlpC/P60 family protein [Brevundimonas sp.]|uniref:C40 family peptidase n=1 Tax=Brevundimonas sp. TaxID=1871086 RepID=UPI0025C73C4C|nr:NlpC/P60 family protein [Brevundimonas sp.]
MTLSAALDERTMLARPDLAELGLEGIVRAKAYRPLSAMHAAVGVADIHDDVDPATAARVDQLLFGEAFDVLDRDGDRVWGRARRDGTVGWVNRWALAAGVPLATHRVASVSAVLPLNALVHHQWSGVAPEDLSPIGDFETDPVSVAERMLGVPHALGARSSTLTDCSGLVQQTLYACGRAGPRHSDRQAELGRAVDRADLRRGDLVVWLAPSGETAFTGHSALALDAETLIHATGHHGAVVTEPLAEAEARYAEGGFQPPVFRRLDTV